MTRERTQKEHDEALGGVVGALGTVVIIVAIWIEYGFAAALLVVGIVLLAFGIHICGNAGKP